VTKTSPSLFFVYATLLSVPLWLANPAAAQTPEFARVLHSSKLEVEQAIQALHATESGRLPILDGFVKKTEQLLDRYRRAYYECSVQVMSTGPEDTRVRVTAKITAWYVDTNAVQSGYRVLPSNGRLETDLLDRIEEALASNVPGSVPPPQAVQPAMSRSVSASISPVPSRTTVRPDLAQARANDKFAVVHSAFSAPSPGLSTPLTEAAIAVGAGEEDLESLQQRREDAEKRMRELNIDVQNLEEILHNQSHPANIAVVRKSGTRVMAKPGADAPVLFSAHAEDEFEILDSGSTWVHVQISGVSRGWIRRTELDLPEGLGDPSKKAGVAEPIDASPFRVVREATNIFKGDWEPLHGKTIRIIWTEPALTSGKQSSAQARRDFAKSLLLTAYQEVTSHDPAVAGVVIVFDSADGGQIAVTLESLKQWRTGKLSEASFWQLCSVDPPELFRGSTKGGA
jgi:hypothetical protein